MMTNTNTADLDLFALFADANLAGTITLAPIAYALAECAAALFFYAANNNLRRTRPLTYKTTADRLAGETRLQASIAYHANA